MPTRNTSPHGKVAGVTVARGVGWSGRAELNDWLRQLELSVHGVPLLPQSQSQSQTSFGQAILCKVHTSRTLQVNEASG